MNTLFNLLMFLVLLIVLSTVGCRSVGHLKITYDAQASVDVWEPVPE